MTEQTQDPKGLRVFVSHISADRDYARRVRDALELAGVRVGLDEELLPAGGDWTTRLREELSRANMVLVVWSPQSMQSSWVAQGFGAAWALGKPILAVRTHPELNTPLPVRGDNIRVVALSDLDDPKAVARLMAPEDEAA